MVMEILLLFTLMETSNGSLTTKPSLTEYQITLMTIYLADYLNKHLKRISYAQHLRLWAA